MGHENTIRNFTLLLAIIAGFCDTLTFVIANEFSAHVTGNFIVFAYDVIKGGDSESWIKLITLPVFIAAVIAGGWVIGKTLNKYTILLLEGIVLAAIGLLALFLEFQHISSIWLTYGITMPIVFAMGLQNAFGKLFSKETYGPTTMMTGNVTQAALDFWVILKTGFGDGLTKESFRHQAITIGGFFTGCVLGAVAGKAAGLSMVILPGIALIIYSKKMSAGT
jgi:uncharacterized membrane protein YoaK (UPF0700 family)